MKNIDQLITEYTEKTAAAVEPVYEQTRAEIHSRMSGSAVSTTVVTSAVIGLVLVLSLFIAFNPSQQPVTVIPTTVDDREGAQVVNHVERVPDQPQVQERKKVQRTLGHDEPVLFKVDPNNAGVEKLIADHDALANAAVLRNDFESAARVYFNLARTLELHDKSEQVVDAFNKAIQYAAQADANELVQEIQKYRELIGK